MDKACSVGKTPSNKKTQKTGAYIVSREGEGVRHNGVIFLLNPQWKKVFLASLSHFPSLTVSKTYSGLLVFFPIFRSSRLLFFLSFRGVYRILSWAGH